jgi:hypothetical protein
MTKLAALDDGMNGLIATQKQLPPTVTLIQPGDDYPDYLYTPSAFHDWCTLLFSLDELFTA